MNKIDGNLHSTDKYTIKKKMFWMGFLIGLFLGANFGVVIAGIIFSSKARESVQSRAVTNGSVDIHTGKVKKDACQPAPESDKDQKEQSGRTVS